MHLLRSALAQIGTWTAFVAVSSWLLGCEPSQEQAFSIELQGAQLLVHDSDEAPLYMLSCSGATAMEKADAAAWVAPADERHPSSHNPGYYLDGEYIEPEFSLGCDIVSCYEAQDPIYSALAYEYVKVGSEPAPAVMVDPRIADRVADPADTVETRPLSGKVRVRVRYFRDAECQRELFQEQEIVIPEPDEGVCCPVGDEGCSVEGPGGGWAPTLDACAPFSQQFDTLFELGDDPRGCPTLGANSAFCCNCAR